LGSALLVFSYSNAQTHVNTSGKKYTLLEEATGTWCGWCPDGAQVIEEKIEPNYPHTVILSWHNGDPLVVSTDPFCTGSGYITGFPEGTVNRSSAWSGGLQQNRGQWEADCTSDSTATPNFDISMTSTFDPADSTIRIAVKGKALAALTGKWNINAYITQDSITSAGANSQHSYLYTASYSWFMNKCASACPSYACSSCAVLPDTFYSHMNVVKAILASGSTQLIKLWGDTAFNNPAVGTTVTKNYTYKIAAADFSKYKLFKVIGTVQKFGTATTDRVIENSIQSKVSLMAKNLLSVGQVNGTFTDMVIYPNPAGNYINIESQLSAPSAVGITISNVVGQVVLEKQFPTTGNSLFSEIISLNNFSNGVYLMTLTSNGEKITKKFVVQK